MPNDNLSNKWKEFGWDVRIVDGHNYKEIFNSLTCSNKENMPKAIIANTIKGKGVSIFENNNKWHHNIVTKNDFEIAVREIKEQ